MTPSPLQDPSGQLCSGPSGCCLSYPGIGGQFPGEMREAFPQNSPVLLPPLPLRAGARNKLPQAQGPPGTSPWGWWVATALPQSRTNSVELEPSCRSVRNSPESASLHSSLPPCGVIARSDLSLCSPRPLEGRQNLQGGMQWTREELVP